MDLTTAIANTKVTWKVDGECHYVDLVPPADPADHRILESLPYRVTVKEYFKGFTDKNTYYYVFFGRHVLRSKIYDRGESFLDIETAKREALKFAARMLIEALCNISPDITAPFHGDIDFAFLGINPDEIEESVLVPGWTGGPIDKDNFPRAKRALELAGFEVDSGTNAEKQMFIWWKTQ